MFSVCEAQFSSELPPIENWEGIAGDFYGADFFYSLIVEEEDTNYPALDWGNPFNAGLLYQTCSCRLLLYLIYCLFQQLQLHWGALIMHQFVNNCTFLNHRNHVACGQQPIMMENIFNQNSFAFNLHSLQCIVSIISDNSPITCFTSYFTVDTSYQGFSSFIKRITFIHS